MELLCPECRGGLVSPDGQTAHCTIHGGQYRILFSRYRPPAPSLPDEPPVSPAQTFDFVPGTGCIQHPTVVAAEVCRGCGAHVCRTCAMAQPDGGTLCPACAVRQAAAPPRPALMPPVAAALPPGVRCVHHPHLAATTQCTACGAFLCATCVFALPGRLQLCPTCATTPRTTMSPRRKRLLIGSLALAVWTTLVFAALFAGAFAGLAGTKEGENALGLLLTFLLLAPSVTGLALGLSAKDRRLANPPVIWVAVIWNGLVLGGYLLLCLAGLLMGG